MLEDNAEKRFGCTAQSCAGPLSSDGDRTLFPQALTCEGGFSLPVFLGEMDGLDAHGTKAWHLSFPYFDALASAYYKNGTASVDLLVHWHMFLTLWPLVAEVCFPAALLAMALQMEEQHYLALEISDSRADWPNAQFSQLLYVAAMNGAVSIEAHGRWRRGLGEN